MDEQVKFTYVQMIKAGQFVLFAPLSMFRDGVENADMALQQTDNPQAIKIIKRDKAKLEYTINNINFIRQFIYEPNS